MTVPVPADGAATGLRARHRRRRSAEILRAAADLFVERGYEKTTMDDIAGRAGVSLPTLYRFHESKAALLIALYRDVREQQASALAAFCEETDRMGPVEAMAGLLYLNNSGIRTDSERRLWRDVVAATMRIHDADDDRFHPVKQVFERTIEGLLIRLRDRGAIRADVPLGPMVSVLYAIANEDFQRMIANQFPSGKAQKDALFAQVALVLGPWAG